MVVSLKKATINDIPKLIEIEKSVAGTKIYSPMLTQDEWIKALEIGVVYLIKKNGIIVGNISHEKKGKDYVHISGLAITPQFQGQGIAREVLKRILVELKNAKRIDLATHPDNEKALKLYKSLGFIIESTKENYYGDGEPRLILAKEQQEK